MTSSKWPTLKWVVLLYITTDHSWHCDVMHSSGSSSNTLNCLTYTYILFQNEPDCPGYPTEWFTVDVDGVQVADLTANAVQSLTIKHANGSVTLSLPLLSQPLPENAVTLNMTKYNAVPTNRSDDTGNIAIEMVTWGTSAVFGELSLKRGKHTRAIHIQFYNCQGFIYLRIT